MRRAGRNTRFLFTDPTNESPDTLIGIILVADFTAEHEWGISTLQESFGISYDTKKAPGLKCRTATKVPERLLSFSKGSTDYLMVPTYTIEPEQLERFSPDNYNLDMYSDELVGAWDRNSFGIAAKGKYRQYLPQLRDAIKDKNLVVMLTARGPFNIESGGLGIFIKSRIPNVIADQIKAVDQDRNELEKAADQTGIEKELKKAGKTYYALSPRWADENKKEVVFWLNPTDQHKNNYGLYDVKQLRQWIAGTGPIPKSK